MDDLTRRALWNREPFTFGAKDAVKVREPKPKPSRNARRAKARIAERDALTATPEVTVKAPEKPARPVPQATFSDGGADWTEGREVIRLGDMDS